MKPRISVNLRTKVIWATALTVVGLRSLAADFQEITLGGQPTGERGSYVVRNGVLPLPYVLPTGFEGHAGLLTGVSEDKGANLVYEIRGGGTHVQLSKFSQAETWGGDDSFLETHAFKGCGHPPYVDGLSAAQKKVYLEEVDAQAWRAIGRGYVNLLEVATVWQYDDGKDAGVTYISGGVPQVPDRFRCDGLVEWSYEAAQAVITGAADGQVDSSWGVYNATGLPPFTRNDGIFSSPSDLYAPYGNGLYYKTSGTTPDLPDMRGLVSNPVVSGKSFSVSWTAPFDVSGIFQYAYGWIPVGVLIDVVDPDTLDQTSNLTVPNGSMPQGIYAAGRYRFVVFAMDKLGHWSSPDKAYQSPEIDWNPTSAPPTILLHPASQTAYLGQSITFSVSASGVAPLSYQWLESSVDIPGATGATLTIPNVSLADSGRSFSARVTNPQGSVTSSSAVLTVSTSLDTGEPNDSSLTGTPLPMGSPKSGYISSPTDVDWFKVVVDRTGLLTVGLTVPSGLDYDLEIYGPDYLWKLGSYNLAGLNERIDLSLLQTGTYYVRVYGYPVGSGAFDENRPYQITANLEVAASGVIDTAVTWAETVDLTGDVIIAPGGSLTIQPGTQIRIPKSDDQAGGNNLNITEIILDGGTLTAVGTEALPIVFTSSRNPKTAGDWYGIRVKNGYVSMQHCVVEYAAEGIRFEDTDTRFETYALSDVTVRHCTGNGLWTTSGQYAQPLGVNNFKLIGCGTGLRAEGPVSMIGGEVRSNNGYGINANTTLIMDGVAATSNTGAGVYNTGSTTLTGGSITHNGETGFVNAGGSATVTTCTITHNGGHGVLFDYSILARMDDCNISNNAAWGIYGRGYNSNTRTAEFRDNLVQNNGGGGVHLDETVFVGLSGNVVNENNGIGLDINLRSYTYYSTDYGNAGLTALGINGNSIFGNSGPGVRIQGSRPPVLALSNNDIYNNTGFEIRNESSCTVVADGNFWGEPTNTELTNGASNLSRIYDLRDGASRAVMLTEWYAASITGGSPGPLQSYVYPLPGVTRKVEGALANTEIWNGKILVIGDVTLTGSLTIEPGTEVVFEHLHDTQAGGNDTSRSELILDGGTLTAVGTEAAPIVFTSSRSPKTAGDWYGIRVKNGNASMQHCVVEYAAEGIRFEDTDTRFETYALSDVTVRHCTGNGVWTTSGQYAQPLGVNNFKLIGCGTGLRAEGPVSMIGGEVRSNNGYGINANTTLIMDGVAATSNTGAGVYNTGSTTLTGGSITHNGETGFVNAGGSATVTTCTITHNGGHGVLFDYSILARMDDCNISNNAAWGIYGRGYNSNTRTAEFRDNLVQNNGGGGVHLDETVFVGLSGNVVNENNGIGLDINLRSYTYYSTDYGNAGLTALGINGNSIFGNSGPGVRIQGSRPPVLALSNNDIYNNTGFEIRNESSCTVVADGNFWGEPTNTELTNGASNLSRIYDLRDGAMKQVQVGNWYPSSFQSGNPGSRIDFTYGVSNITQIVQGVVAQNGIWRGRILVIGDVIISADITIEEGSAVIVVGQNDTQTAGNDTSRSELILDGGTLTAVGTEAAPIVFTSSRSPKTAGDWYGIRVKNGNASMQHCVVEYAAEGIRFEDTDTRFETYALSDVTVRHCTGNGVWTTSGQYAQPLGVNNFKLIGCGTGLRAEGPVSMIGGEVRSNNGYGINANTTLIMDGVAATSNTGAGVYNTGSTTLTGGSITHNGETGFVNAGGSATVTTCTITHNGGHGVLFDYSILARMDDCNISNNAAWGIYGRGYNSNTRTAEFRDNLVQNNGGGGVHLDETVFVGLSGNVVNENNGIGLDINLRSYTYYSTDYGNAGLTALGINGNSIFGNSGPGVRIQGSRPPVLALSNNDIYNNTGFEIRNESSCTVVADGNFWGEPTNTELTNGASNLSRIYDLRDGASRAVMLTEWYAASITGGSPGPLQSYVYPLPGVTRKVEGALANTEIWNGKILVIGDVTLTGSLTIEPGTEVVFEHLHDTQAGGNDTSRSELILDGGTLTAVGTEAAPIVFTSSRSPKTAGDWYGIRVKNGNASMQHCVVEYAAEGIRFEDTDTRFETYALSDVTVRHCTGNGVWTTSGQYAQPLGVNNFKLIGCGTGLRAEGPVSMIGGEVRSNNGYGINANTTLIMDGVAATSNTGAGVYNTGSTTLTGGSITHNGETGFVNAGGSATVTTCTITHNGGHGVLFDYSILARMDDCNISNNAAWGIYGRGYNSNTRTAEFRDNLVQNNGGGGVHLDETVFVGLSGNVVNENNGIGLDINLRSYTYYSTDYGNAGLTALGINGNSIFGNSGPGVRIQGSRPPVLALSNNDIYNNTGFEIRNESGISITAENVYLGKETATEFGKQANLSRIYDQHDHPAYGQVVVQSLNTGTMLLPPEITTQPQGAAVILGGSVTLTVAATGSGTITYRWYRNGVLVPGATSDTLTLTNFDVSRAGAYHAVAVNVVDETVSDIAQVSAILPQDPDPSVPIVLELGEFMGYNTIDIWGEIGRAYTIQTSDDLTNWDDFQTLILLRNPQTILDWDSLDRTNCYYRAVLYP